MEHQGTKRIETERLILRPFTSEDAPAMYRNWAADPEVAKFLTWKPYESVETANYILRQWARQYEKPDFYQWAIELKSLREPIGSLSVVGKEKRVDALELGYCIGRNWWGQGLMPEAVRAVTEYLFREVRVIRVSAKHDVNNPNSGRVMQKAGMTFEGILRSADSNNQGVCDVAVYSILASELK